MTDFEFKLFPEYEYTKLQKKRFRFSQGRVEHFRKAINEADRSGSPNTISLVYMIGYNNKIRDCVQKTKNNVVVLCADVPEEMRKIHDNYWDLMKDFKTQGYYSENVEPNSLYYDYINPLEKSLSMGTLYDKDTDDKLKANILYEKQIISDYMTAKSEYMKYYKRYIILDKLHPEKTIAHENLNWIVKRYFPRGREEQGCGDAVLRPTQISKAVLSGIRKEENAKVLGLPKDAKPSELFKTTIKRLEMDINTEIREKGFAELLDIYQEMKKPPYGWDEDCHAAYCFGCALSGFIGEYYHDGIASFPVTETTIQMFNENLMKEKQSRWRKHSGNAKLFKEDGWRLVNRLALMFNVKEEPVVYDMIREVKVSIEKYTKIPVSIIDNNIMEIFNMQYRDNLLAGDTLKKIIKYFDWDKCKDIREKYDRIDEYGAELYAERYPDSDVPFSEIIKHATTECSGFLWDNNFFWRVVEDYLRYFKVAKELSGGQYEEVL